MVIVDGVVVVVVVLLQVLSCKRVLHTQDAQPGSEFGQKADLHMRRCAEFRKGYLTHLKGVLVGEIITSVESWQWDSWGE